MRILYLPNSHCQQRQLEKPNNLIYPVHLAMEAQKYRNEGHDISWGNVIGKYDKIISQPEGLPFLSLPHPDRVFTDAKNPKYQRNGNFKYLPATYIQSANGCWWGKCEFCVEKGKPYEVRPVEDVIEEIRECEAMGFKEVFDDSATFPVNNWWLDGFCNSKIVFGPRIPISCNMRMIDVNYEKMKAASFRMLLFGLESANQFTLDKISKGVKVEDVKYIIKAANAGLEPHIAVMFGYPWESDEDATKTLRLVHWLLKKGHAKTAQASFYQPNNIGDEQRRIQVGHFTKRIYDVAYSPEFWFNKIKDIKNKDDLKYLWRQIKAGINDCRSS